ncbi:MAG TPA: hypothetical protein VEH62_13045 [Gemmatimonadales bacterium]|nr:hypothetical protein [Gemmatimonadales bacterium]
MKRSLFVLVSALALLGSPAPAHAKNVIWCMLEAVSECDSRFPPTDYRNVSIRGWCYMITTGICAAS